MEGVTITLTVKLRDITPDEIIRALGNVSTRSRIVVVCLADGYDYERTFILAAKDGGYMNNEYVYIFSDTKSKGFYNPVLGGPDKPLWEDMKTPSDGRDKEALLAFEKAMIISNHMGAGASSDDFSDFKNEVIARMKDPPFSCTDECTGAVYSKVSCFNTFRERYHIK
ncbi:hypothetical protein DICVIV_14149 [Dictyocaulus viviparus]|uniref:Receptor ligand binding region domain-containing protein n=1 Tax=Dictyocaulus viviparus TaxID=29172 RepID=A0A0D8X623_DICVI|nr:hypothetical protein DICVIV_14149 [Dictyocaulus viviparus]